MSNDNKITDVFLNAIQNSAEKEKQQIEDEIKALKEAELKKSEDEGLSEAFEFIQKEIEKKRASIRTELAKKERQSLAELFMLRKEMTEKVFARATEKLTAFTQTSEYKEKLLDSAKKLSELFGSNACTLQVKESDLRFKDEIASAFKTTPKIETDNTIKLGGIKGVCTSMKIIADETLDSRLELQYDWFIRNSTLKVV